MKNSKRLLSMILAVAIVFSGLTCLMGMSAAAAINPTFEPALNDNTAQIDFDNIDVNTLDEMGYTSTRFQREGSGKPYYAVDGEVDRPASAHWFSGNGEDTPYYVDGTPITTQPVGGNTGLKPVTNNGNDFYLLYSPYDYENFKASAKIYWGASTGIFFGKKNAYPWDNNSASVKIYFNAKQIQLNGAIDLSSAKVTGGGTKSTYGEILIFKPLSTFTPEAGKEYTLNIKVENNVLTVCVPGYASVLTVNLSKTYEKGVLGLIQRKCGGDDGGFKSLYVCNLDSDNFMDFDNVNPADLDAAGFTSTKYSKTDGVWGLAEADKTVSTHWYSGNKNIANFGLKPLTSDDNSRYLLNTPNAYENFEASMEAYWNDNTIGMVLGKNNVYPTTTADTEEAVAVALANSKIQINGAVDFSSAKVYNRYTGEVVDADTDPDINKVEWSVYNNVTGLFKFTQNFTLSTTENLGNIYKLNVKMVDRVLYIWMDDYEYILTIRVTPNYQSESLALFQGKYKAGGIKSFNMKEIVTDYINFDSAYVPDLEKTGFTSTKFTRTDGVWNFAENAAVSSHCYTGKKNSSNYGLKPLTNNNEIAYYLNAPKAYENFEASAEIYWTANGTGTGFVIGEKDIVPSGFTNQSAIAVTLANKRVQICGAVDVNSGKTYKLATGEATAVNQWKKATDTVYAFYFSDNYTFAAGTYKLNIRVLDRVLYVWVDGYENMLSVEIAPSYKSETISLMQRTYSGDGLKSLKINEIKTDGKSTYFDNAKLDDLQEKGFTATEFTKDADGSFVASTQNAPVSSYWFTGKDKNSPYYKEDGSNVANLWYTNYGIKPTAIDDGNRYYLNTPYNYRNFRISTEIYWGVYSGIAIGGANVYPNSSADSAITLVFNNNCVQIQGAVNFGTASVKGSSASWDSMTKMFNFGIDSEVNPAKGNDLHTLNVKLENRVLTVWVDDDSAVFTALVADHFNAGSIALTSRACTKDRGGFKSLTVEELTVESIPGDLNGDADVNAVDLTMLRRMLLADAIADYDINGDGFSDIRDFVALKKLIITAQSQSAFSSQVWVDAVNGADSGEGSEAAPYKTLSYAFDNVANDGTVTLIGEYNAAADRYIGKPNKTITLTGGTFNLRDITELNAIGNIILTDINIKAKLNDVDKDTIIYANGNHFTVDDTVTFDGRVQAIYGGGRGIEVEKTNLNICAGTYVHIYAGSNEGTVLGDTHLNLGGNLNPGLDVHNHDYWRYAYGGGNNDTVKGNTYVTFGETARINTVYGGGSGASSVVEGVCNLTVNGGAAMSYYGGSDRGAAHDTVLTVNDGEVEQIFGGSYDSDLAGNTDVNLLGGTVSRRIYGGCYNETAKNSLAFATDHYVDGTTDVYIGSKVNFTATGISERAICAGSRNSVNHSEENAVLSFETNGAYTAAQSYIGCSLLGVSGYDTLYVAGVAKQ